MSSVISSASADDGGSSQSTGRALSSAPDGVTAEYIENQSVEEQLEWRRGLAREAANIEMSARSWALAYRSRAGRFHAIGLYFAVASALVATLAGATGIALPSKTTALLALAAAALTAISAVIGAPSRTQTERAVAAQNWILCAKARVFRTTVAPYASPAQVLTSFDQLCYQRDGVWQSAPVEGQYTQRRVNQRIQRMAAVNPSNPSIYSYDHPFGMILDLPVKQTPAKA